MGMEIQLMSCTAYNGKNLRLAVQKMISENTLVREILCMVA